MKKVFGKIGSTLLLFFFMTSVSIAQNTIVTDTNILNNFQNTENPIEKFDFFFTTVNRYQENSAYDWLEVVQEYLNASEDAKDSIPLLQYKIMEAQIYHDIGDYDRSVAVVNEVYVVKKLLNLETQEILLDIMDGNYAQLKFFDKQLIIREEKKSLGIRNNIVFYDIYSNLGLHRKAMDDYIMEAKKAIENNDLYGLAQYNAKVGNYLRLDKSPAVALTNLKKAKGFADVFLNDITTEKTESQIIKTNLLIGIIEGNIGKCYVQLKEFEKAIPSLEQSIATIKQFNKNVYSIDIIENTLDLIDCHLQLEDYKMAKTYLDIDLNLTKTEHFIKRNRLFAGYYDRVADYQRAVVYLKKNARLIDSIEANDTTNKEQQLQVIAQYDFDNSRKRLDQQDQDMAQAISDMQEKDEKIYIVFILLVFTFMGFAGLVYAYLRSIKSQRLIAEQKHIIESSLIEKDSLLKEIHHRVKNNLQMVSSLLSLQTKNTRSKAAIAALEEGKSRVKAMALIHQKLYQNDDLSVIEMQGYIESLVNSVQSVFKKGGHNINLTIDAEGVELDIDRAIPFGLILNELVSNSFKYAFPDEDNENGKIYIHLRKNNEIGFFEYSDNGIGLPADIDERKNDSMGVRLMNRLVNQLQSTLNVDKTSEGVRYWFNFK